MNYILFRSTPSNWWQMSHR